MTFQIFFPFFLDQFWQELVMTHHQQTIIRGIDDTTCTVKNVLVFLYTFDRKGGRSSIYSPCLRLRLHVDYHHMHLLPQTYF